MIRTYALRVGMIFGVPLMIDATFAINVLIMATVIPTVVVGGPVACGIWIACAYASLVTHELAHVGVSTLNGVKVSEIRLHVLGATGVPETEQPNPNAEILTAAAGPVMSLALGFLLAIPLLHLAFSGGDLGKVMPKQPLLMDLGLISAFNVLIAVFNLLPLYPMDGGRILRGLLTKILGNVGRATTACASITVVASFAILVRGGYGIAVHRDLSSLIPIILGVALGNYALREIDKDGWTKVSRILRRRGTSATATTKEEETTK